MVNMESTPYPKYFLDTGGVPVITLKARTSP